MMDGWMTIKTQKLPDWLFAAHLSRLKQNRGAFEVLETGRFLHRGSLMN